MVHDMESGTTSTTISFLDQKLEQLGGISNFILHELRTPLTSIHGVLKLLQTAEHLHHTFEDKEKLISIAITAANRLTRLANALEEESDILQSMISIQEMENLQLENDLRSGLSNQEFSLVFQPIIHVEEKRIAGFEALARWCHPTKGYISPDVFIPVAEKSGLINDLGLYFLREACQILHQWQQQFAHYPPLTMSINLSSIQLSDAQLGNDIEEILNCYNIHPNTLILEVTESGLITNSDIALETILKLKKMKVDFYIDDFGTGYSSLSRLQDLPFDAIKIDKSFVMQKNWTISKAILLLADSLQVSVIAEGIETVEQLKTLKGLGCNRMQGFYFSKPVNMELASQLLVDQISHLDRRLNEGEQENHLSEWR